MRQPRWACILLLFILPGCAASLSRLPEVGPIATPSDLIHFVSTQTDSLHDLEIQARIHLRIDGVKQKGTAIIFYRSPDALKIDIRDTLIGIGLLSARTHGDSLGIYLPRDNQYLEGPPEEVLNTITGVDLTPYTARNAILGLAGLSPLSLPRLSEFERRNDSLFVEIIEPLWTRRLWFDPKTAVLLKEQIHNARGRLISSRRLTEYENKNGIILPRRMEIIQGNDRIQVQISTRKINTGFPNHRFNLKLPADVVRLNEQP